MLKNFEVRRTVIKTIQRSRPDHRNSLRMLQKVRFFSISIRRRKVLYSGTLQLPKTKFGPKAPSGDKWKLLVEETGKNLYEWQRSSREHNERWVLHDGPPYANGSLHMGHALNKIVKDIINRWEFLYKNKRIEYKPGWDCHGLPIEMKAISNSRKFGSLKGTEIRKKCRQLATEMIHMQRSQFQEFCIMTDFDDPYLTLLPEYEIRQLAVFIKLLENGLLKRQLKPVWWGCENKTALAEAELEYNPNHSSVAIYVKFPISSADGVRNLQASFPFLEAREGDIKLLIWTSTPWTIPANEAICINENIDYTMIYDKGTNEHLIVAKKAVPTLLELNKGFRTYDRDILIKGKELLSMKYRNPAAKGDKLYPILHGDHVTELSGSGLVHTAPAHGGEDFIIGCAQNLPIASCVDHEGAFIKSNIPEGFSLLEGLYANRKDGIWACISILQENNMLYHLNKNYVHSYPYDWRSKKPVIQRATPQWFVNLDRIKPYALEAIESTLFFPESGRNRLEAFVKNRSEWCISRQRTWGVPLPFLYEKSSGEPLDDIETVKFVINRLAEFGTDSWFEEEEDVSRWLPEHLKNGASNYIKGQDTMDVWFDSGTSWTSLGDDISSLFSSPKPLADLYLEGSDQHRGWFQSSLLNKIVASGRNGETFSLVPPFKRIITHGFILDNSNEKMSKSKGNVISPSQVIKGGGKQALPTLGTDGLRLWVASSNYWQDVNISKEVLERVSENLKKLRITFKFLLGNIHDFQLKDEIPYEKLNPIDKYILSRLTKLQRSIIGYYNNFNYSKAVRDLNTFISVDLSSQYFDISKDCLYTDLASSHSRRSVQTVLQEVLKTYIGLIAPIQPLTAEEVWSYLPEHLKHGVESPFKIGSWNSYFHLPDSFIDEHIEEDFEILWKVKDSIYKMLEGMRLDGIFKNKLETRVNILVPEESKVERLLSAHLPFMDNYFLVSKVSLNLELSRDSPNFQEVHLDLNGTKIAVQILPSDDHKCPRCWKFISKEEDTLCLKCNSVVHSHSCT